MKTVCTKCFRLEHLVDTFPMFLASLCCCCQISQCCLWIFYFIFMCIGGWLRAKRKFYAQTSRPKNNVKKSVFCTLYNIDARYLESRRKTVYKQSSSGSFRYARAARKEKGAWCAVENST